MKEYILNDREYNYLISIIVNTRNIYFRKLYRREEIAKFESIEKYKNLQTIDDLEEIEDKFLKEELLRIVKPYLTKKELNVLESAINSKTDYKKFKRYLFYNKNYEYKILSKLLKKIGGLFNE